MLVGSDSGGWHFGQYFLNSCYFEIFQNDQLLLL